MLAGYLGKLTGEAIRGLARGLFAGFYEKGLSANKALEVLKSEGLGYRRQDFLNDFRVGLGRYEQAIKVRFVNRDAVPSEGILESQYHGTPDRYSFVFKASGYDPVSGEERDLYFFMHRGSIDTRGNMESEASDWLSEQPDAYPLEIESVNLLEGYINPLWK